MVCGIFTHRIDVFRRSRIAGNIRFSSRNAPLFEREFNSLLIKRLSITHVAPTQFPFCPQKCGFSCIKPKIGGTARYNLIGIGRNDCRLVGRIGTYAQTVIIAFFIPCPLGEHCSTPGIIVTVHIADNVGSNSMISPVVIDQCHAVFRSVHHRIVCIGGDHAISNSFRSFGFGDVGLNI